MSALPRCLMSPRETGQLIEMARGKVVLELGTWYGETTIEMARVADRVWTVDHHQGDAHLGPRETWHPYFACLHESGVQDRVVSVVGRFKHVLHVLKEGYFQLVLVDGAHDLESVQYDCRQALCLVHPEGVVAVHDYGRFDVLPGTLATLGPPNLVVDSLAIWHHPR